MDSEASGVLDFSWGAVGFGVIPTTEMPIMIDFLSHY